MTRFCSGKFLWLHGIVFSCLLGTSTISKAQDNVVVRLGDGSKDVVRTGLIIDWKGNELRMEINGRVSTIENQRLVEVESQWPKEYEQARELIRARRLTSAIEPLQQALGSENRPWAKRMMLGQLIPLLDFGGQHQAACEAFLRLLDDDPETRDFDKIPLAWENLVIDARFADFCKKLMGSSLLPVQLLGASWLVSSPERGEALKKLEGLSRDIDGRIAHLASAQLWRVQMLEADSSQITRWERQIDRMPKAIRPGPLLALGEAQQRLDQSDAALISWMQIPILYRDNFRAASFALRQSASVLQNNGRQIESRRLWNEIIGDFPDSPWVDEALAKSKVDEPRKTHEPSTLNK